MKKSVGSQQAIESADDELVDQLTLFSWHGLNCANEKRHSEEGEFHAELVRFKNLRIYVQEKTHQFGGRAVQYEGVEWWTGGNIWM